MVIEHLKFNTDTKMWPIIGYPMGHSSAAYAWNTFLVANNVNEIMWPVEIPVGGLPDFMSAVKTLGLRHFSLTMPHKAAIIPLLDEVDPDSRFFNSVNLVKIDKDGKSHGMGFDGYGNLEALRQANVNVRGMNILVLGAGSIVGVILQHLARAGAEKATVINRSYENAKTLVDKVKSSLDMKLEVLPFSKENLDKAASECDLIEQCTPQGMFGYKGDWEYLGFIDKAKPETVVLETIVNPPATTLVKKALQRGLKVIFGIDMMVGNKVEAFRFALGIEISPDQMAAAKKFMYRYFKLED